MTYAPKRVEKTCEVCKETFLGLARQKYCPLPRPCARKRMEEQLADLTRRRREKRDEGKPRCPHCGQVLPQEKSEPNPAPKSPT